MPQIIIKGLNEKEVISLAKATSEKLANICECPSDWFVYDSVPSKFFSCEGEEIKHAVVAVHWFKREQAVQDKVAICLDTEIKNLGFETSQVSFSIFEKEGYYEDGEHY